MGDGMAGRQVLDVEHHRAARAVELHDPAPVRMGAEPELGGRVERHVDLTRVAVVDQAPLLVVALGRAEVVPAPVAHPASGGRVEVECLGDAPPPSAGVRGHAVILPRRLWWPDCIPSPLGGPQTGSSRRAEAAGPRACGRPASLRSPRQESERLDAGVTVPRGHAAERGSCGVPKGREGEFSSLAHGRQRHWLSANWSRMSHMWSGSPVRPTPSKDHWPGPLALTARTSTP